MEKALRLLSRSTNLMEGKSAHPGHVFAEEATRNCVIAADDLMFGFERWESVVAGWIDLFRDIIKIQKYSLALGGWH